jgi:hypothetical protein
MLFKKQPAVLNLDTKNLYMKYHHIIIFFILFYSSCTVKRSIDYAAFSSTHTNANTNLRFSDDTIQNIYNSDNIIYKPKRQFIYTYKYINKIGEKFIIEHYSDTVSKIFLGRLIPMTKQKDKETAIDRIGLYVFYGKGDTKTALHSNTLIKYDYFNFYKKQTFSREITAVSEDTTYIFLHPFRNLTFTLNYLYVYPIINFPIQVGEERKSKLDIFDNTAEDIKPYYNKGNTIPVFLNHYSKITGIENVKLPFKKLKCYKIETIANDETTDYEGKMDYYFNEEYGFVKFVYYDTIDDCDLIIELEQVIDYE